jgi:hypothetical protein
MDTVGILESNWRNVRNILQHTQDVLSCLFVGLFPKKKKEMPTGNLRNLVEDFDTLEDPTLQLKLLMTHKYRGCIVVLSINKSVEPNEEQKVLMSGFDQGFTVNTSKRVFRGIW